MVREYRKTRVIERLRNIINYSVPEAHETNDAEADLLAISFESIVRPEKHAWVYTRKGGVINIDLEDWNAGTEWDKAIARVREVSIEEAVDIIRDWLSSGELPEQ